MDFQTLPYLYVTISFLLEICFWGPTHPTFSDDVTNYTLFLFEVFPNTTVLNYKWNSYNSRVVVGISNKKLSLSVKATLT